MTFTGKRENGILHLENEKNIYQDATTIEL